MEKLTLGEFRDFTKDLSDNYEIRVSSIQKGEQTYHTEVYDITSSEDVEGDFVILEPSEIEVDNGEVDLDNFADYLIENASECFEHQDRKGLIEVLKRSINS
ncbi:hypothetical protein OSC52_15340 [Clostridium pasteurianum]|uniref:hypothetical protein n=1 Tax=Clostridium pasteurianum TaxID=1501 RepID=UPI002260E8D9|nr:hypothetical protein [Clostridium pasteurianum]UZW13210.1 hypothetical protein OSC52_15340 [Clostridium pasteurianum]